MQAALLDALVPPTAPSNAAKIHPDSFDHLKLNSGRSDDKENVDQFSQPQVHIQLFAPCFDVIVPRPVTYVFIVLLADNCGWSRVQPR